MNAADDLGIRVPSARSATCPPDNCTPSAAVLLSVVDRARLLPRVFAGSFKTADTPLRILLLERCTSA